MTSVPSEVDPAISEHVIAIRNRFGISGLREAARIIAVELVIFQDALDELAASTDDGQAGSASVEGSAVGLAPD